MAAGQCSRCGAARTDGWAFCRACGAVDVPAPRAAGDDVGSAAERPVEAGSERDTVATGHAGPERDTVATGHAGPERDTVARPEAVPAQVVVHDRAEPAPLGPAGSPPGPRPSLPRATPGPGHATAGPRPYPAHTGTDGPSRVRVPLRGDGPTRRTPATGVARGPVPPAGTGRDWLSALVAAAATLAVLAVPGALLAVVAGIESPAVSPLMLVPVAVALGVGGSVSVQLDLGTLGGLDSVVAGTPLLVTVVAVATGASLVVGDARPAAQLPAQALRSFVLFLAGLTAVALTGRAATAGGAITVAVLPTVLGGALWFAAALAFLVAWRRQDVLPPALRRARDLLAGPVAGTGAVLGSCWLGGLALVVAGVLARAAVGTPVAPTTWLPPDVTGAATSSGSATAGILTVVGVVMLAPTALLGAFAFCLGIPLVGRGPAGENVVGLVHLLADGPSWWLAPLVAAIVCVLGGMVAALHAPTPEDALRRGWSLGPALAVVLALVSVVTALSAGPLAIHLDLAPAVVLGLGWGGLGGLLGAVVAPGLPPALRQGRLGGSPTGQVVGALVVVGFLGAALVIGLAAAAGTG